MKIKNYLKILSVTMLLGSCVSAPQRKIKVKLKNQKICVVAGDIRAGADCANTLGGFNTAMTVDEVIKFLEGDPKDGVPPGVFMSLEDFSEMKTALDLACSAVKDNCSVAIR